MALDQRLDISCSNSGRTLGNQSDGVRLAERIRQLARSAAFSTRIQIVVEQTWNAQVYERNARFVSDLAMPVVELLDPQPSERILDLAVATVS